MAGGLGQAPPPIPPPAAAVGQARMIDTRMIGRPDVFEGADAKWPDWSVVVRAYWSLMSEGNA
jgi:hypothetical protein